MHAPFLTDKSSLRRELRARRRALSATEQRQAARALALRLARVTALRLARRIALYWPMDGEIDPRLLPRAAGFGRHDFYLPVLRPFPALTLGFARWHPGQRLHRNRFGIPEPRGRTLLPARSLDALLMPLTGFDAHGNRLGMGGGFYDRTLAFRRRGKAGPLLVGVAHACQQVTRLPTAEWDVPASLVVTDRHRFD
ncbi:MAG TPA: 5-formyltetrahydrofolate cyclo-ligase [Moraxellaceae bacterium]|nr:5-formyltetrahydrofolate cyclo-ligase [Moraxellaceae bacterium]